MSNDDEMRLLTRNEATDYLRLAPNTLACWAAQGKGPKYHKIGGKVVYKLSDLNDFVNGNGSTK